MFYYFLHILAQLAHLRVTITFYNIYKMKSHSINILLLRQVVRAHEAKVTLCLAGPNAPIKSIL